MNLRFTQRHATPVPGVPGGTAPAPSENDRTVAEVAEVAVLVFDSLTDGEAVSVVRGAAQWRQLSFRASGLTMELSITATGNTRRLIGQLLPRQPASVEIRHGDSTMTVQADDLGRFTADDVPAGPVSIRCRLGTEEDHRPVTTGWITI